MHQIVKFTAALLACACVPVLAWAQVGDGCTYHPGVARWPIKTSVPAGSQPANAVAIPLQRFISLPNLIIPHDQIGYFQDKRIPAHPSFPYQEGQIVSTIGFLQWAKCEVDDNDYHLQLSLTPAGQGGCLIVEVPDSRFADPALAASVQAVRQFVRQNFFAGAVPHGRPHVSARVEVVGQLFFDAPHLTQVAREGPGGGRGSGQCAAKTLWEIHPILAMHLVSPPHPLPGPH